MELVRVWVLGKLPRGNLSHPNRAAASYGTVKPVCLALSYRAFGRFPLPESGHRYRCVNA
jgi:hypothetical protein